MPELERLSVEQFKEKEKKPIIIALDNVRSMHNVGSVFRTADAFAVQEIILGGITPSPPHRDIHKAALGADESVHWSKAENLVEHIKKYKSEGWSVIGIEQVHNSKSLEEHDAGKDKKCIYVFGHEVHGIEDNVLALCDECLEIPQEGTKHSLNISVSVGIVLWAVNTR